MRRAMTGAGVLVLVRALAACSGPAPADAGARADSSASPDAADASLDEDAGRAGFVAVSIENGTNCALHSSGAAVCWGEGFDEPMVVDGPVDQVAAGSYFGCFLRGDRVDCIASSYHRDVEAEQLAAVPAGAYRSVATGADWACGVRTDGQLRCWGWGPEIDEQPMLAEPVRSLRLDWSSACAITESWRTACWDRLMYRILPLPDGLYADATTGFSARCGIDREGRVRCVAGECRVDAATGEETCTEDTTWMDQVGSGPGGAFSKVALSMVYLFACGLRIDGELVCWGDEYDSYLRVHEPVGARFRDVDAGYSHVCGVTMEGQLLCWGDDPFRSPGARYWGQFEPPAWP